MKQVKLLNFEAFPCTQNLSTGLTAKSISCLTRQNLYLIKMRVTFAMLLLSVAFLATCTPVPEGDNIVVGDSEETISGGTEKSVGSEGEVEEEADVEEDETQSTGDAESYIVDQIAPDDDAALSAMLNSGGK